VPLVLVDYPVRVESAPFSAAGSAAVIFDPVPAGYVWRVDALAVGVPLGVQNNPVLVYDRPPSAGVIPVQGTTLSNYLDWVTNTNYAADFDDQGSPLTIPPGGQLVVVFGGGLVGQQAVVRAQYGLYQGVAGQPTPVAGATPGPPISPGI
jgi:hypothetical protein